VVQDRDRDAEAGGQEGAKPGVAAVAAEEICDLGVVDPRPFGPGDERLGIEDELDDLAGGECAQVAADVVDGGADDGVIVAAFITSFITPLIASLIAVIVTVIVAVIVRCHRWPLLGSRGRAGPDGGRYSRTTRGATG
jgi:hypothetical protein